MFENLKRLKRIKKKYYLYFKIFAYLTFEKSGETFDSLMINLPDFVKIQTDSEITYILYDIDKREKWDIQKWNKLNEEKYNLIIKLYMIFIFIKKALT